MIVVYKNNKFTFEHEDNYKDSVLRVIFTFKDSYFEGDFLYLNRMTCEDIIKEALLFGKGYKVIIFEERLFVQSNIELEPYNLYSSFPNGETCKKALKYCFREPFNILTVQDDGTRSIVGSIYYALRELKLLKLRTSYNTHLNSPVYVDNLYSTSNSSFTRAKWKFDYMDVFNIWDFVITPINKEPDNLINKLDKETQRGYIVWGSFDKLKNYKYTKLIKVNKGVFLYVNKYKKGKEIITIKPGKMSNKQLIACLKKDIRC